MIELKDVKKSFGDITAVNSVSLTIRDKEIFGLLGTNGAGKSTLLRIIAGVIRPEEGSVTLDERTIFDQPKVKEKIFFVPDDAYFFPNSTPLEMGEYYSGIYPEFSSGRFLRLLDDFSLDPKRRINTFSKGMKRQLSLILGFSAQTKYLLCDETFDGLDPVVRQAAKSLIASEMEDRGLTPVISSHSLREIEDVCDHVGLLHQGGVLLSEDLSDMRENLQKIQVVFADEASREALEKKLHILVHRSQGRMQIYTIRGSRDEVEQALQEADTIYSEHLHLSLEEMFISETEVVGYDVQKFILS